MTEADPMPELCHHDDSSWCNEECEEKARKFDEWIKREVQRTGDIATILEITGGNRKC
jgi:aromatic ring-opening dioxygenase catalytic subunit (LigB family)